MPSDQVSRPHRLTIRLVQVTAAIGFVLSIWLFVMMMGVRPKPSGIYDSLHRVSIDAIASAAKAQADQREQGMLELAGRVLQGYREDMREYRSLSLLAIALSALLSGIVVISLGRALRAQTTNDDSGRS